MARACGFICDPLIKLLEICVDNPESFLESRPETSKDFKYLTKVLYDTAKKIPSNVPAIYSKSLSKLLTNGFDNEQIWQQIALDNDSVLKYLGQNISDENVDSSSTFPIIDDNVSSYSSESDYVSKSKKNQKEAGYVFDDDSDDSVLDQGDENSDDSVVDQGDENSDDVSVVMEESESMRPPDTVFHQRTSSEVDDKFFKLSQLEEYLKLEDLKYEKNALQIENNDISDVDMFGYISSDDEGMDDSNQIKNSKKDVMYEDFFDPPESEGNHQQIEGEETVLEPSRDSEDALEKEYDTRDYEPSEDEDDVQLNQQNYDSISDKDFENPPSDTTSKLLPETAFEKQQAKEKKKMKQLEESLLTPKPWQLTGEVAASERPENSLMRQPTTFDSNATPNVITTDELTEKVEEIVRMAISNKAWSDVERKIKPTGNPNAYRREEELKQTKSKKSLAEIYEEDYLKLKHKPEEGEDPKHVEIKKLMNTLIPELNALFAYIPKPPAPEIKVVSNLPAITIEDVAPTSLSDAALLAPEEVKKKAVADFKGQTERNITDKKRERRKKKVFQKMQQKKMEEKTKKLSASNPSLAKKHEKVMALKKIKQHRNTDIVKEKVSERIKSSKDFFSRLQDKVDVKAQKQKKDVKMKKKSKIVES